MTDPSGTASPTVYKIILSLGIKQIQVIANVLISAAVLSLLVGAFGIWVTYKESTTLLIPVRTFSG